MRILINNKKKSNNAQSQLNAQSVEKNSLMNKN